MASASVTQMGEAMLGSKVFSAKRTISAGLPAWVAINPVGLALQNPGSARLWRVQPQLSNEQFADSALRRSSSGSEGGLPCAGQRRAFKRSRNYLTAAQAADGEPVSSQLEQSVEEAEKQLSATTDEVKNAASSSGAPEKSEDILRSAAQQLRGKANNLKSQASTAREQILETAGKTKDDLAQQAGQTVEQLKAQTDKTAAQLKEEAEKATEELRIQAEKAKAQLAASAHETAERAKEELARVKHHAPNGVKELAEVAIEAHSKEKAKSGAVIHDFCLGIPYGGLLVLGGLLWFIMVGSLHAVRFGVLLGGIVLATSVQSLRMWEQGKSTTTYIGIQGVIALVLAVKEYTRFTVTGAVFPTLAAALVSAAMVAFYAYVVLAGGPPKKKSKLETGGATA